MEPDLIGQEKSAGPMSKAGNGSHPQWSLTSSVRKSNVSHNSLITQCNPQWSLTSSVRKSMKVMFLLKYATNPQWSLTSSVRKSRAPRAAGCRRASRNGA